MPNAWLTLMPRAAIGRRTPCGEKKIIDWREVHYGATITAAGISTWNDRSGLSAVLLLTIGASLVTGLKPAALLRGNVE